jgi:hypothetical protein
MTADRAGCLYPFRAGHSFIRVEVNGHNAVPDVHGDQNDLVTGVAAGDETQEWPPAVVDVSDGQRTVELGERVDCFAYGECSGHLALLGCS